MALTPEDVLNKTFTQTQFRRGYDEREVDDFLDEVVAEMRRMVKDSENLRSRADDGGTATASAASAAAGASDKAATGDLGSRLEKEAAARTAAEKRAGELERRVAELESSTSSRDGKQRGDSTADASAEDVEADAKTRADKATVPAGSSNDSDASATQMAAAAGGSAGASSLIALAQRLHDEHVAEGRTQRDKLVAEAERQHQELVTNGQSKHDEFVKTGQSKRDQLVGEGTSQRDKLVSDAQAKSGSLVTEAEAKRKKILDDLNAQKTTLEARISELTTYERDYRRKLKDFISGQLKDLEAAPAVAPQESAKH